MAVESALLVVCPAAEDAVAEHRSRMDRAAFVGVPAHITVLYPFKSDIAEDDHSRLANVFASMRGFDIRGERTDWFGDQVLFVAPTDPAPLSKLTSAVAAAFPGFQPYLGAFDEVVPHLTVGHDHPFDVLRAAEREIESRLPFVQSVEHVELWSGPSLATADEGTWRHVSDYALAPKLTRQ